MTYKLTKTSLNPDPYYGAVSLLLSGDGANNSTDIRDSSRNTKAITVAGNAKISTAQSKFGGSSLAFGGSGDYLSLQSDTAFAIGTDQYTVELWVYFSSSPSFGVFFAVTGGLQFSNNASGRIAVAQQGVAFELSSSTTVPLNQWAHLAATRDSSNITRIFLNGSQIASGTITTNYPQGVAYVNYNPAAPTVVNAGYIDDLRITKGVARYTSNFTLPTQPFLPTFKVGADPEFFNTSLLLHGDGANGSTNIVDSSYSTKTITANGNAKISTAQSKWNGSSLAFDGSGDYLTIPDDNDFEFGAGDFTVEAWVYPTASPNQPIIVGQWSGALGAGLSWVLVLSNDSNRYLRFILSTNGSGVLTDSISSSALTLNAWNHVALVRYGNVFTAYLNGVSAVTYTISAGTALYDASNQFSVGSSSTGTNNFNGYIDDLRITKGIARYTSNFTPPTAPFPNF